MFLETSVDDLRSLLTRDIEHRRDRFRSQTVVVVKVQQPCPAARRAASLRAIVLPTSQCRRASS